MINTNSIFEDRKKEIDFLLSVIVEINDNSMHTSDNGKLIKILKSNFILMLYNMIEACVMTGMTEIYQNIESESCEYNVLIEQIQNIWFDNNISKIFKTETTRNTYTNTVKKMIDDVLERRNICLDKELLKINGNLDARAIKKLCDTHRIRYRLRNKGEKLLTIKTMRNSLAHGEDSFENSARDLSITDITTMKDEVYVFITDIIQGMNTYYENKSFKV